MDGLKELQKMRDEIINLIDEMYEKSSTDERYSIEVIKDVFSDTLADLQSIKQEIENKIESLIRKE